MFSKTNATAEEAPPVPNINAFFGNFDVISKSDLSKPNISVLWPIFLPFFQIVLY